MRRRLEGTTPWPHSRVKATTGLLTPGCRSKMFDVWASTRSVEKVTRNIVERFSIETSHYERPHGNLQTELKESNVSRKSSDIQCSGSFFVRNLSGSDIEKNGLWPAELIIGVLSPVGEVVEETRLSCVVMTDGEIDYEIDQLIAELEDVRRAAKRMLTKHRDNEDRYLVAHGLLNRR
jgi:hypothetical protein